MTLVFVLMPNLILLLRFVKHWQISGDPSRNIIFRLNVHCPDGETPMNIDIKPKKKGKGCYYTSLPP